MAGRVLPGTLGTQNADDVTIGKLTIEANTFLALIISAIEQASTIRVDVARNNANGAVIGSRFARYLSSAESAIQNNDRILRLSADGFDGTDYKTGSYVDFRAGTTWSGTDNEGYIRIGVVPSGATTPSIVAEFIDEALFMQNVSGAPAAITGAAGLFCDAGEMKVIDASGNITQISPHDPKLGWRRKFRRKQRKHVHMMTDETPLEYRERDIDGALKWIEAQSGETFLHTKQKSAGQTAREKIIARRTRLRRRR